MTIVDVMLGSVAFLFGARRGGSITGYGWRLPHERGMNMFAQTQNFNTRQPKAPRLLGILMTMIIALVFSSQNTFAGDTVYSAFDNFSETYNPSPDGVWSYGYKWSIDGNFIAYNEQASYDNNSLSIWRIQGSTDPNVVRNNTSGYYNNIGCITFPPNEFLHMHPGFSNQYSVVRFTAPRNGHYKLDVLFKPLRTCGRATTTDEHVVLNTEEILSRIIWAYFPDSGQNFFETLNLVKGDTIDFVVGNGDGNSDSDSTGLKATITLTGNVPQQQ